jgi:hypothetical protein
MIRGDSSDYDLLEKWTKDFDCQGYKTCEIGVREGLGSKIIMDNVRNNYIHVGVDPYIPVIIQMRCGTLCYMILNLIVMKVNLLYAT